MWVGIIAAVCAVAAILLPPLLPPPTQDDVANAEPALTPDDAGKVCLELSENPKEYLSGDDMERRRQRRRNALVQPAHRGFVVLGGQLLEDELPHQRVMRDPALLRLNQAQRHAVGVKSVREVFGQPERRHAAGVELGRHAGPEQLGSELVGERLEQFLAEEFEHLRA